MVRIAAKTSQKVTKKEPGKPDVNPQWSERILEEDSVLVHESKIKVKTRSEKPIEESDYPVKPPILAEENNGPSEPKVEVGRRTLEVLQTLFPRSNFEERTKSVDWAFFVQAMGDVGFVARQ